MKVWLRTNINRFILEHISSSGDDREHAYSILASGEGTGGESSNLREARPTYIGDNGYVFYINPDIFTWCFEKLKKYFDFY